MQAGNIAVLVIFLMGGVSYAHGGRLDANGGHTNRKTGEYHYHRGGGSYSAPAATPRSNLSSSSTAKSPSTGPHPFANCAEARAAGAVPVMRGSPGYGPHLDRDGDGIGCEPYRGKR